MMVSSTAIPRTTMMIANDYTIFYIALIRIIYIYTYKHLYKLFFYILVTMDVMIKVLSLFEIPLPI